MSFVFLGGLGSLSANEFFSPGDAAAAAERAFPLQVTHVVSSEHDVALGGKALAAAIAKQLPVVKLSWVEACVADGRRVSEMGHLLKARTPHLPLPLHQLCAFSFNFSGFLLLLHLHPAHYPSPSRTVAGMQGQPREAEEGGAGGKKRKLVTVTVKGKGAVDPDSGLDEGAHIFQRREEVSTVLLHRTFLPYTCMGCWLLSLSSPVRSDLLVVCC